MPDTQNKAMPLRRRKILIGLNVWFIVSLALVLLIIVNAIIARMPQTAAFSVDMTEARVHTLSDLTRNVLRGLTQEIQIVVLKGEGIVPFDRGQMQLQEVVSNLAQLYDRESPRVKSEIIDFYTDRTRVAQISAEIQGELYPDTVIIRSGDKKISLQYGDLVIIPQAGPLEAMPMPTFEGEEKITSTILKVTEEKQSKVYFLTGHGELLPAGSADKALSTLAAELRRSNYLVDTLNLASAKQVPQDCDLMVIAGPMTAFDPAEADAIHLYLELGGKLLLMVRPKIARGSIQGLREVLRDYDVEVQDDRVIISVYEDQLTGRDVPQVLVVPETYAPHPVTEDLPSLNLVMEQVSPVLPLVISPSDRSAEPEDEPSPYKVTPIMFTTKKSWAESNLSAPQVKFDEEKDIGGPLSLAVAVAPRSPDALPPDTPRGGMRMVVVGSPTVAADLLVAQYVGNRTFLMNATSWLLQQEMRIGIPPKRAEQRKLALTPRTMSVIFGIAVIGMPLAAALAGAIVWWVRRR